MSIRGINSLAQWFADKVTDWTGSTPAFLLSVFLIVGWLATGPYYSYCDTWQLVANTFTTLVEFVMVFVLQCTQNKYTKDMHNRLEIMQAKLDLLLKDKVESE